MNNKLSRLSSVILDTKIHGTMIKVLNEYKLEICQLSFFVTERRAYSLSLPSENMDSHNLMPLLGCDCIYFMRCPWYLDTCPQSQQWQRGSVLFFFLFVMFLFKRMYLEPEIKWPTSVGSSKKREFQKNIDFCCTDYTKAFDCVDHDKLWKILQEMGIPDHLPRLLRNLYAGQEAIVRTGHGTTDWFQIKKGVRQGCMLSPCLLNLYAEYTM